MSEAITAPQHAAAIADLRQAPATDEPTTTAPERRVRDDVSGAENPVQTLRISWPRLNVLARQ
jgi:hypothetical protein